LTADASAGVMHAMLAIISPAKKLDLDPLGKAHAKLPITEPELLKDACIVQAAAKKLSAQKLAELMDLSEALAELNHERFQAWDKVHALGVNDAKPAALMFAGDVYSGLDAPSLDAKTLLYAQTHLVILSGLYGLLRPLDLIQPYRLEMGSKLVTRRGKDLYQFWGDRVAAAVERRAAESSGERAIINLASVEYMKVVQQRQPEARQRQPEAIRRPRQRLETPVIEVAFKELKDDKAVALMLFAKRARGMMARFILSQRVDRVAGLKDFEDGDYRYDAARSNEREWCFTRPYRTVAMGSPDD